MRQNQIRDDRSDEDDESAATEVVEAQGADGEPTNEEWIAIVNNLWIQYDEDQSGYLER